VNSHTVRIKHSVPQLRYALTIGHLSLLLGFCELPEQIRDRLRVFVSPLLDFAVTKRVELPEEPHLL